MKTHNTPIAIALMSLTLGLPTLVAANEIHKARQPIHNRYIVVLKGTAATPDFFTGRYEVDVDAKAGEFAHKHHGKVARAWKSAVKGMVMNMTAADAQALAQDPDVALVEEDGLVRVATTQASAAWNLDRIDQQSLPLLGNFNYFATGSGVTAYVVDTGILTTHSEFGGRAKGGFTAIADGKGTTDCNGHGTHVAGTLGGATYGVAKSVNLVSVRVLDCTGSGTTSAVISGIDWITKNRVLPAVANLSLGGGLSPALDAAVQTSIASGVTYVIAAGNGGVDACTTSPADVSAAITVGATDSADNRASYSNYGTCVDAFAPGSGITSAWYTGNTTTNTQNGTSMAAPHIAGAAALYLSKTPGATPAQVATALTNNATPNKVINAGTGSPNKLLYTSFIGGTQLDLTAPTASLTSPTASQSLVGTVTLAAKATDNVGVAKVEFFANSSLLGTATAAPYQLNWNSTSMLNGTYAFTAKTTDSAGLTKVSTAVNATIVNPVSAVACSTSSQLLLNPGFEAGASNWTAPSTAIINNTAYAAHGGTWKAKLNGDGVKRTDTLYQQLTIPADVCTATMSFWLNIATLETTKLSRFDTLTVTVRNSAGTVLGTLGSYSNLDKTTGYVQKSFNLLAFKGQTVRLQFSGVQAGSLATTFLIDDVNLNTTK